MADIKWIKIKGQGIEDVIGAFNFTNSTFEVEAFEGPNGVYEVSGDLPSEMSNPSQFFFESSNKQNTFRKISSNDSYRDKPQPEL